MERDHQKETVLVAMSGGVGSSVAALLLRRSGMQVKGAILRMHDFDMSAEDIANGKLPQSIWYAREAARKLRMDFSILDVREEFRTMVSAPFAGDTEKCSQNVPPDSPQMGLADPCLFCNRYIKFPQLYHVADRLECGKIATGHYARILYNEEMQRFQIRKSRVRAMDQSDMLYVLSQDALSRLLTPLGDYEPQEIRTIAAQAGLKNAQVPDSSHICFLDEEQRALYRERIQMKGTERRHVHLSQVNFVSIPEFSGGSMRVTGKLRYAEVEVAGTARVLTDGTLEVELDDPVPAVPGQSLVLYEGDLVVAGGVIIE